MHETGANPDREDPRLSAVLPTIGFASARYAARFAIEPMREEIEAESTARVLALIAEGRTPFDTACASDDDVDRIQRFTHGLVANVAREALRGRLRHAHVPLEDRAAACAALRVGQHAPERAMELEEAVGGALERFRSLSRDVRETIVAEEIMQNRYASDDADRLCRSVDVSFQRVFKMIENRNAGKWTAEAWRQRVHRSRKKARAAVGALAAISLVVALAAAIARPAPDAGPQPTRVTDNGSTQNGKKVPAPIVRLASTQNGSHGTSMGGDGTPV